MRRKFIFAAATTMILLAFTLVRAEVRYNLIYLRTLGGNMSQPWSINKNGQVVGAAENASHEIHATLFDITGAGSNIDLGTLGGEYSCAWSINNEGQIIGEAQITSGGDLHATIFDSTGGGNNFDLGTLGTGTWSQAISINDNEQIVGSAYNAEFGLGYRHATLFDKTGSGNNIDLGTLGGNFSHAYKINNTGQIVGLSTNVANNERATLFSGNNIDMGTLGGDNSRAQSINDSGQIVGWAYVGWPGFTHATLFDSSGGGNNIDLGTLGGNNSVANSINNSGKIVGYAETSDGSKVATLFDATGSGNNIDLNNLIDQSLGRPLREAYCINDNGLIVGQTYANQAFLLTPIPPTPPFADGGFDQTVTDSDDNGSEEVTLDGSCSSDIDGTIVSWVWTDNLGDIIPDGEIVSATLSVGIHTITLIVTDDDDLTDSNTVTITVEPCPNPPDANANGPYTIYVDDILNLDASGSTDDDNDIVSYIWDLDDNNNFETDAGDQPVFDVNFAYLQSIGLLVDNTYNIHLKVTDSVGQSDVNDTTLTILPIPALQVIVDIKPGSCPNPVNVKSSGVLPLAILGTVDYDITNIDPTSVRLAGVDAIRSGIEDVATPVLDANDCNCTTSGPDGFLDLTLKFKTQRIVETIGEVNDGDVLELALSGMLFGESPIEGADCILILNKYKPFNKADINKDGVVNLRDFAIFTENWLQSSIVDE